MDNQKAREEMMNMRKPIGEDSRNVLRGKVGIMTFPNSVSHGAALQMYALYKTVENLGYDAEIINYSNSYMKRERHTESIQESGWWKGRMRLLARQLVHVRLYTGFSRFEKDMVHYPRKPFEDKKEFVKLRDRYDSVICGSDQVWNPQITDSDLSYFLDFCGENTKRIAYAPSFGVETLDEEFGNLAARELRLFSALSVREVQGAKLVESLLSESVSIVVDPTFLVPVEQWRALEKPCSCGDGEYILYYSLRHSPSLWQFCKKLEKEKKMRIVVVGGNPFKNLFSTRKDVQRAPDVNPGEWLYLLSHASYVVTNSFHGTAFSINYRKNFFVGFSSKFNSRLENIISTLGLNNQVVDGENCCQLGETDYTEAERVLPKMCSDSRNYLKNALMKEISAS